MMRIERAAGGIVIRLNEGRREVLMIDDAYGHVTFPKGHLEPGESWEDAAVREIREETGVEARILAPLGRVEYQIQRDGEPVRKQVRLFLLEEIDEADNPIAQLEEIEAAYFIPWNEAKERHGTQGYANWSWVFDKADVLWDWYTLHGQQEWRSIDTAASTETIDAQWAWIQPWMARLQAALQSELQTVAPEIAEGMHKYGPTEYRLPLTVSEPKEAIRNAVEHTVLKPEAGLLDVLRICGEAKQHQFRAVCVNPGFIEAAASDLKGTAVIPCTVVGFPLGASATASVVNEALQAVKDGATDVDMVLPIGAMREDDIWTVYDAVKSVTDAVHNAGNVHLKVIFECHFLTYAQVAMATLVCMAAGADFVKTSTGFAPTGAKLADVALMAYLTAGHLGVKAAGGVRTPNDALQFLRYGATALGTSSGPSLIR